MSLFNFIRFRLFRFLALGLLLLAITQEVTRYLEEKEYDKVWATATAIPSATVMPFSFTREEAQYKVVLALVKEGQIDRAVHFADQVECDPWDNPPSEMSPWTNKRYSTYRVIVSQLIDNEEFERARSFAVPRFSAEDSIFEEIDSAEKPALPRGDGKCVFPPLTHLPLFLNIAASACSPKDRPQWKEIDIRSYPSPNASVADSTGTPPANCSSIASSPAV